MVERHPVREVWAQAWPSVLTMVSYTLMQFVDSLMVAQVGSIEMGRKATEVSGVLFRWRFCLAC